MKSAGSARIAKRYVKAIFDVASQSSAVEAVESDFASLGKALAESAEFRDFLENPLLPAQARAAAMLALLEKLKAHQLTRQFFGMLLTQKRLTLLPAIITEFANLASAARGEVTVSAESAVALSEKDLKDLAQRLSKAYGRPVRLSAKHNPALLGGMILKMGSQQLDSSLAGKMRRLGQALRAA